jgi:hypothetical protein
MFTAFLRADVTTRTCITYLLCIATDYNHRNPEAERPLYHVSYGLRWQFICRYSGIFP